MRKFDKVDAAMAIFIGVSIMVCAMQGTAYAESRAHTDTQELTFYLTDTLNSSLPLGPNTTFVYNPKTPYYQALAATAGNAPSYIKHKMLVTCRETSGNAPILIKMRHMVDAIPKIKAVYTEGDIHIYKHGFSIGAYMNGTRVNTGGNLEINIPVPEDCKEEIDNLVLLREQDGKANKVDLKFVNQKQELDIYGTQEIVPCIQFNEAYLGADGVVNYAFAITRPQ